MEKKLIIFLNTIFGFVLDWQCTGDISLRIYAISVYTFKGTVSVILSDPSGKNDNARFTTGPLKALSDQI